MAEEEINVDLSEIPTVQQLRFVLGNPQASHMSDESTFDEHGHILAFNNDLVSGRGRGLQQIFIRQGDATGFTFPIKIFDGVTGRPADLTGGLVFSFDGQSANGPWFRTVDTFDLSRADEGIVTWSPPSQVAQYDGYFKFAHFNIESNDRSQQIATLDFTICVIKNDIPMPTKLAPVLDEYHRVLQQTFDIGRTIDEQNKYVLNFVSTLADAMTKNVDTEMTKLINDSQTKADNQLNNEKKTVDKFVSDNQTKVNNQVNSGQKQIDNLISDQTAKLTQFNSTLKASQNLLDTLKAGLDTLKKQETDFETQTNAKMAAWDTQITGANLVTKTEVLDLVKQALKDYVTDGNITFDDFIKDDSIETKLDKLLADLAKRKEDTNNG